MAGDAWDPGQYHRFRAQRSAPFHDLVGLLQPVDRPRVVDLGCGTGELTAELHRATGASETTGIDNSEAMLEQARAHAADGLRFETGDIARFPDSGEARDVVFSNAALQWVPDHERVLAQWATALAPGGQLAVQVPANADHASHRVAAEVAASPEFASEFDGDPPADPVRSVLAPERYACLLDALGFAEQHVRLQVYGHRLDSTADVVEWVRGTSLTRFQSVLPPDVFATYVEAYRHRLIEVLGDRKPYFYAFKRVLMWARLPAR